MPAGTLERPDPARSSRAYVAGVGFFIFVLLVGAGVIAVVLRRGAIAETRRSIDELSLALTEQTGRSFQAVDLALQDTANRLATATARAGGDRAAALASPEVNALLLERLGNVPQLSAMTVVDGTGRVVNFTRAFPSPAIDVTDRDYFRALQDRGRAEPFVSAPVRSRANGEWTVFLARRLDAGGVLLGVISLDAIERFFGTVTTKPGSDVTLLRDDGVVLARFPHDDGVVGRPLAAEQGVGRLIARHDLRPYGLSVQVGVSERAALAAWRRQLAAILTLTAAACGGLLLMLNTVARRLRAEHETRRSLAARNNELEQARLRLEHQARELTETAGALRASERLLAERSTTLHTTLEHIEQGILMVDPAGLVVAYNQRAAELLDLPVTLLARRPAFRELLQHQWEHGEFVRTGQSLQDFVRAGGMLDRPQTYERERPNGRVIEVRSVPLPGGGIVRTYTDITERREAENKIRLAATTDELTGLANRAALKANLEELAANPVTGASLALVYLDLDRFRLINDARGHAIGDRLLVGVGRRLVEAAGPGMLVARIGGDEFAIAHRVGMDEQDPLGVAARSLAAIARPYVVGGLQLSITASAGIAFGEPGMQAEALMRNADIAMYRAKDAGGNKTSRYEPGMAAKQEEQFQVEQALREALHRDVFQIAYQPVVSLESNAVVGYEALLRWTDLKGGEISPEVFIPVAESTGLIVPLGRWVLERACFEAASWTNACRIAVNLSPVQFGAGGLLDLVQDCLARSGLSPERLELEVTEGVLLGSGDSVLKTIEALRSLGVKMTLDDFGTGHAGLSYLRRFPFDKLKIDRSFVRNLGGDNETDAIVEAILLLADRLGIEAVAEGVESERQLERLRELRCPLVQGFLTGRPMSPELARAL